MVFLISAISIDIGGNLIPNLITILTQLGSTAVLFVLFRKFLYQPVLDYIEKRNEAEQSKLTAAELALENANEIEAKRQQQFKDASKRVNELIEAGKLEAQSIRENIIAEGEQEIEYRRQKADKELKTQVNDARNQLRQEAIAVAMLASEKLLKEKYNELSDKERIESFVEDISS